MHLAHSHCHHDHHVQPQQLGRSFAIAVALNVLLVAGEAIAGWWSGSIALIADAGHNLSDVAGLLLAWGAFWLTSWSHRGRWTYGWRAFTIMAAHLNAVLLSLTILWVFFESVRRMWSPVNIDEWPVIAMAAVAAVLNFATATLLARHGQDDLNVRGAYLHMLADAAVSLAVVVGTFAILATGWLWLDPAISIGICVLLAIGTWRLLRESTSMLMHAAPAAIDLDDVRGMLGAPKQVISVLDLHVWSVSTTEVLMTCRLVCQPMEWEEQSRLLDELHHDLDHGFGIRHATLEVASADSHAVCSLERLPARNILT